MKRDMDLCREILLYVEACEGSVGPNPQGHALR